MSRMCCPLLLVVAIATSVVAAEPVKLPEGFGLSAKYPGDEGIGRDATVLLAADFEAGDVAALVSSWNALCCTIAERVRWVLAK